MIIYAILDLTNSIIIKKEMSEFNRNQTMKNAVIEVNVEGKNE